MGRRCLYFSIKLMTADMPSSCEMSVYRNMISAVIKCALVGSGGRFSVRLKWCVINI